MAGTTWTVFAPATKAKSSEVNANFDWIEGSLAPMNAGSQTDAVYSLGTTTARWLNLYLAGTLIVNDTATVAGVANIRSSADKIMLFRDATNFTTTAYGLHFINDAASANIPLEIRASKIRITAGDFALPDTSTAVSEFSTDGTLAGNSDIAVPTEKAVKTYIGNNAIQYQTGSSSGYGGVQLGTVVTTITALSLTSDGGVYRFMYGAVFRDSVTSTVIAASLEVNKDGATIGSADLVEGGFSLVRLGSSGTIPAIMVSGVGLMSITSGGHTFYFMRSSTLTPMTYHFIIDRVKN